MPKEKIQEACSKTKYISQQNKSQYNKENININIIQGQKNGDTKNEENKMEIEPQNSNDLIASNSTKYSNNTKLSVESSNQISHNTNLIFYPSSKKFLGSSNNEQQNMINSMNFINNNINNEQLISEKKVIRIYFFI